MNAKKVQGRVDRAVKELQEQTPKVERNAKRIVAGQKPRGRNPKTDPIAHGHDVQRMEYIARSLKYLTCQLQRLLGVVDQSILDSRERQEELDTLLELFFELCEETPQSLKKEIEGLLRHVQGALAGFCPALDSVQEQAALQLGEQACHLIGWAPSGHLGTTGQAIGCFFSTSMATDGAHPSDSLGSGGSSKFCCGELAQHPSSPLGCPSCSHS